jgi:hypothetical protein
MAEKKIDLQNLKEHYNGIDGSTLISIPQFAHMPLSEEKVAQLLRDFPDNWSKKIDKKLAEKHKAEVKITETEPDKDPHLGDTSEPDEKTDNKDGDKGGPKDA